VSIQLGGVINAALQEARDDLEIHRDTDTAAQRETRQRLLNDLERQEKEARREVEDTARAPRSKDRFCKQVCRRVIGGSIYVGRRGFGYRRWKAGIVKASIIFHLHSSPKFHIFEHGLRWENREKWQENYLKISPKFSQPGLNPRCTFRPP